MRYEFLVDTYATERVKVVSVWSEFRDGDLPIRPRAGDPRGRSVHEQMVHQCVSEDLWFRTMLGIDVGAPPLPASETRREFMKRYAEDSGKRLAELQSKDEAWWEGESSFFDVGRSRAWIMVRRMTHTSHHRGQLMAMLRMLGHSCIVTMAQRRIRAGLCRIMRPRFMRTGVWRSCCGMGRRGSCRGQAGRL